MNSSRMGRSQSLNSMQALKMSRDISHEAVQSFDQTC